jgi:hypothetical protein
VVSLDVSPGALAMIKRAPNRSPPPPFPSEHPRAIAMREALFNYCQEVHAFRVFSHWWYRPPASEPELERAARILRDYGVVLGCKRKDAP